MNQLNDYIKFVPSQAQVLDNWNALKEEFTELDMREILDMAYQKFIGISQSVKIGISTMRTSIRQQTNSKIFEPGIKAEATKAKSNRKLADKVYRTKGTKRGHKGSNKVAEAEKQLVNIVASSTKTNAGPRRATTTTVATVPDSNAISANAKMVTSNR